MSNLEQTLSIIKPDAVERNLDQEIKEMFKSKGFERLSFMMIIGGSLGNILDRIYYLVIYYSKIKIHLYHHIYQYKK